MTIPWTGLHLTCLYSGPSSGVCYFGHFKNPGEVDWLIQLQHTYEFKKANGESVNEDVSADVKGNYVQYHLRDHDSEIWVLDDFNRVSKLTVFKLTELNGSELKWTRLPVRSLSTQFSSVYFRRFVHAFTSIYGWTAWKLSPTIQLSEAQAQNYVIGFSGVVG